MGAVARPSRAGPLDALLERAGAHMLIENGVSVCSDFGSTASELGVCLRSVGIADRAELVKLQLLGDPERVAVAVEQAVGVAPAAPTALFGDGAWWYGSGERVRDGIRREARLALLAVGDGRLPG